MPFKYSVTNEDRIVFTRLDSGCGRFMFIIIGSIFTFIGICLLIFSEDPELPLSVIRWVVPVFGLGAIFAGIVLPSLQKKQIPDEIIFDNRNGRIEINQKMSEINTGYIYYHDIDDIIVKAKKQSNSSGKSSRTYYTYHVYLSKKDGAQWELLSFNSEAAAMEEILKLKALIRFTATSVVVPVSALRSKKYEVKNDYHRTELKWRNKVGYGPLFLGAFAILFISIGYAIVGTGFFEEDFPVFGMFVIGFIGLIFVIVMVGNIMKMLKNARTEFAVAVSGGGLEYIERDLAGRIRKTVHFPLADIHAISFSFDTENTYRKIFVYTHDQFAKQRKMKVAFSLDSIREMYNYYTQLVSLDMQDLTPVEALAVENFLQEQLKEKGNIQVA